MTFQELSKEKNFSPSITRLKIYEYLKESQIHPSVYDIYKALKPELPTLSKTTVYNVLVLFIEKDIISVIDFNSNESRYEINHQKHSHFQCVNCGSIYDIPYIEPQWDEKALKGFLVKDHEVVLKGICKRCIKESK